MTEQTKETILALIKVKKSELRNLIYSEENKKIKVINNPKMFNHPDIEIAWSEQRIKTFTEKINLLNKAKDEIDQL